MNYAMLLLLFFAGILTGVLLLHVVKYFIKIKNQNMDMNISLLLNGSKLQTALFVLINGTGWFLTGNIAGISTQSIQIILILSVSLVISAVDIEIRKIPNELVVLIMLLSFVFFFAGALNTSMISRLIGFSIGVVLLALPFLLKSGVGGGDFKYIAVMGFCLGYPDIMKALMIMSVVILIWFVYLVITKKGGLKTKFAMGPFISIGFFTTLLFQK